MNSLLLSILVLAAVNQPHKVTVADFLKQKCEQGDQQACARYEILSEGEIKQARLADHASRFAENLDTSALMLDEKRPNLAAVYPLVMHDFKLQEDSSGHAIQLEDAKLNSCAEHYHNHWINKKLWWPAFDSGEPDWESIYNFVVDHYYGFCLKF